MFAPRLLEKSCSRVETSKGGRSTTGFFSKVGVRTGGAKREKKFESLRRKRQEREQEIRELYLGNDATRTEGSEFSLLDKLAHEPLFRKKM